MNYETKCISLWIANSENDYLYWQLASGEYAGDPDDDSEDRLAACDVDGLAKRLESELGEVPDGLTDMHRDLLTHALSNVEWDELAADLLSE